ncbi:MAG TPA: YCF48-related protein, partial [Pyrinomonadaceae bacterium]|nr:YCF48-related protein [Pyrinomonadaceae bacterium]
LMRHAPAESLLRTAGLVLALLLLAGSDASAQQGWAAVGSSPGANDLNTVYFADQKRGWVAGDGGFVSRTVDGGATWTRQNIETKDAVNDIYFRNKEDGYLLAGNSIFQSEDGGQTWREIRRYFATDFGGATPELYSVRFSGKKRGWVVGSVSNDDGVVVDSLVIYTNDAGRSWQRLRVPTKQELIHLDFADEKRGWIVGVGGTILHTADGGESWTEQASNTKATLYHVDFRNERVGWAVGERATILRTGDGGLTWTAIEAPVRATFLSVEFPDELSGWLVGRGGVILRSDDGGRTWIQQETRTKNHLFALFMDKKKGWAVGGGGIILQYDR